MLNNVPAVGKALGRSNIKDCIIGIISGVIVMGVTILFYSPMTNVGFIALITFLGIIMAMRKRFSLSGYRVLEIAIITCLVLGVLSRIS